MVPERPAGVVCPGESRAAAKAWAPSSSPTPGEGTRKGAGSARLGAARPGVSRRVPAVLPRKAVSASRRGGLGWALQFPVGQRRRVDSPALFSL